MKPILLALFLMSVANGDEPSIVFDNRPLEGVPLAASDQRLPGKAKTLHAITDLTIKTVRIRYFNKDTWATEKGAREYVIEFLAHKSLDSSLAQFWSQGVGAPEIECIIEFTDEHIAKLRRDGTKAYREGRLLIWHTESCFRDATGRWWFVNAYDHFHSYHPKGSRELVKKERG